MKKVLVLLMLFLVSTVFVSANEVQNQNIKKQQDFAKFRAQREMAFERRLGLTDEQKAKAKEIRIRGHEKIKPVFEQIRAKKQEAMMVKMSRVAVQLQEERLAVIDKELKVLEKKAHDIRKENMKEFETILTREQKKILKQMKKEGREKYKEKYVERQTVIPVHIAK